MEKIQLSFIPRGLYIILVTNLNGAWRMFSVVIKIGENYIVCVCRDDGACCELCHVMLCFFRMVIIGIIITLTILRFFVLAVNILGFSIFTSTSHALLR